MRITLDRKNIHTIIYTMGETHVAVKIDDFSLGIQINNKRNCSPHVNLSVNSFVIRIYDSNELRLA